MNLLTWSFELGINFKAIVVRGTFKWELLLHSVRVISNFGIRTRYRIG